MPHRVPPNIFDGWFCNIQEAGCCDLVTMTTALINMAQFCYRLAIWACALGDVDEFDGICWGCWCWTTPGWWYHAGGLERVVGDEL